jgi:hypothetical protein
MLRDRTVGEHTRPGCGSLAARRRNLARRVAEPRTRDAMRSPCDVHTAGMKTFPHSRLGGGVLSRMTSPGRWT